MTDTSSVLESRNNIAKFDTANMLGSIEALADQVAQAWTDSQNISYPPTTEIRHIVVAGMGGSGLGADVIKTLFKDQLEVPLDIVHDYTLPAYVNEHTLVVLASYSGTTEEILSCAEEAVAKKVQAAVIAAGGTLLNWAKQRQVPYYLINPVHNPCNQPRMAIGYSVFGMIGLLSKLGLLKVTDQEVKAVTQTIKATVAKCTVEVGQNDNQAKFLAFTLIDRRALFLAAEFLEGATHVATNQFNENAKYFADYKVLPELDHHLLEGLQFPTSNPSNSVFVFINSSLYLPRNQARMALTTKIVDGYEVETVSLDLYAATKLEQAFELITQLSFASLYLAVLEGIDPSPIPYVESFKKELGPMGK